MSLFTKRIQNLVNSGFIRLDFNCLYQNKTDKIADIHNSGIYHGNKDSVPIYNGRDNNNDKRKAYSGSGRCDNTCQW